MSSTYNPEMLVAISSMVALVLCYLLIPTLAKIASSFGLVDTPNDRKQHEAPTPLIGGIAVYLTLLLVTLLTPSTDGLIALVLLSGVLMVLGAFDDHYSLPTIVRFFIQILAAAGMVYWGDQLIEELGYLLPNREIYLSFFPAVLFTIICTIGVINSINMIDGLDGLSATILSISFSALAYYAFLANDTAGLIAISSIVGALLGFLYYNTRFFRTRALVFMGDAGSTCLGFVLVWFFIKYTQGNQNNVLSAVSAGWIFGLPLMDTVTVMVRRIINGKSPFSAGRDHLHHQLIDAGFSVNGTVLVMGGIHSIFVFIGILANQNPTFEPILFWGFVILVLTHFFFTSRILALRLQR